MSCSSWRGEAPLLSFQNFLLENSHLPLKQVNIIMSLIWENSGHCAPPPPPSVKFKVIKICFGHMTARCTAHAKMCARAVKLNSWQEARGVCLKLSLTGAANSASLQFSSLLPPSLVSGLWSRFRFLNGSLSTKWFSESSTCFKWCWKPAWSLGLWDRDVAFHDPVGSSALLPVGLEEGKWLAQDWGSAFARPVEAISQGKPADWLPEPVSPGGRTVRKRVF